MAGRSGPVAGREGLALNIVFEPAGNIRDAATGRFIDRKYFLEANRRIAVAAQVQVVQNIQSRILRPAASTNRLLKATASTNNLVVNDFELGVGVPSWLDRQARYWRTQEQGSKGLWKRPFIGTQLYGLFGGSGRGIPTPVARARTPGLRTYRGMSRRGGYRDKSAFFGGFGTFVVTKEIRAMNAYRDAAQNNVGMQASLAMDAYLARITNAPLNAKNLPNSRSVTGFKPTGL